jgi:hypothetical protein
LQEQHVGLKLIEIRQVVIYADDVNLLGDNIDNIKKNTETYLALVGMLGYE